MKRNPILLVLLLIVCAISNLKAGNSKTSDGLLPIPPIVSDSSKPQKKKVDYRGEFRMGIEYKTKDPYLGSYDNTGGKYLNAQYLSLEMRYKAFFGLYFSLSPDLLFNTDSTQFTGIYLTPGFEREWFEGFTTDLFYSYNAKQTNGGRRLRNLYNNTASLKLEYENDYITPEVSYTYMFGKVTGGEPDTFKTIGYDTIKAMGRDHLLTIGISHTFYIMDSTKRGDLSIKLGNRYNFGTANQLLTGRNFIRNPNYKPGSKKYPLFIPLENPITNDKFGALNTEFYFNLDYTWRFIEIIPEISCSIPFRDLHQAQVDANTLTITDNRPGPNYGKTYTVAGNSTLASKFVVWGGINVLFNFPFRKVK